jgi:hypothetical protein|tara:strand:+ start:99 stop:1040 length:942 start_codon:yes stop_codon:yes gene_type:complete
VDIQVLVSPLAKGAYFEDYLSVAMAELRCCLPHVIAEVSQTGPFDFIALEVDPVDLPKLMRLSFVQGIFEVNQDGLTVVDQASGFDLPSSLVYGTKYAGKTNEMVTQMAINLALAYLTTTGDEPIWLLDPMAGNGSTLLWAARYHINAVGIEPNDKALAGLQQHVKKQTKLKRIKHEQLEGFIGKANKQGAGKFRQFTFEDVKLRLINGDCREVVRLSQRKRFHMIVTDIPYGIAHLADGRRNPLQTLTESAEAWSHSLRKGGALVVIFNTYQPKRSDIETVFRDAGLTVIDYSSPHRMSESIVRDFLVCVKK